VKTWTSKTKQIVCLFERTSKHVYLLRASACTSPCIRHRWRHQAVYHRWRHLSGRSIRSDSPSPQKRRTERFLYNRSELSVRAVEHIQVDPCTSFSGFRRGSLANSSVILTRDERIKIKYALPVLHEMGIGILYPRWCRLLSVPYFHVECWVLFFIDISIQ
jgi:hypothetical protein